MNIFESQQEEILGYKGHQDWTRVVIRNFGEGDIEVVSMPYETWSEPDDSEIIKAKRGTGDREKSIERASRRARTKVRHLCKALRARYMLTLSTKAVITDLHEFELLFRKFVKRLRTVASFRYVAVPEYQERGALHLHIAVANRWEYKLLWSVWFSVVGADQGRIHMTRPFKGANLHRIASYLSKYIGKSFESGALNRKKYWASRDIHLPEKEVILLRKDWTLSQTIPFILELLWERGMRAFSFRNAWLSGDIFWMATG
jgi:hypothetical protein